MSDTDCGCGKDKEIDYLTAERDELKIKDSIQTIALVNLEEENKALTDRVDALKAELKDCRELHRECHINVDIWKEDRDHWKKDLEDYKFQTKHAVGYWKSKAERYEVLAERTREALEALSALPNGYCVCPEGRDGGDTNAFGNAHTGECGDVRQALKSFDEKGGVL